MLSGINTLKTPPKNCQAASQPATIASSVWLNVSHTNMCLEYTAVKISACTTRLRPDSASKILPIRPKSIWHSTPGSPSTTGTVPALRRPRYSVHCVQYRCNVRWGTAVPRRSNRSQILTTVRPSSTHLTI
ncbi:hypothetical protein [Mycobacterium xenopi]|uniref:hypothetical protein n=1 Tax=Mycobacterium xenopi TaxID=1789 RepID=UPI0039E73A0C